MLQHWAGAPPWARLIEKGDPTVGGRRRIETLDFMLSAGADPNVCDERGWTLLHLAVHIENNDPSDVDGVALVPLLLRHKADPARRDARGQLG